MRPPSPACGRRLEKEFRNCPLTPRLLPAPTPTKGEITVSDETMRAGYLEYIGWKFPDEIRELFTIFGEDATKKMVWNVFAPQYERFLQGDAWEFDGAIVKDFRSLIKRVGCEGGRCDVVNGITCRKHTYPTKVISKA